MTRYRRWTIRTLAALGTTLALVAVVAGTRASRGPDAAALRDGAAFIDSLAAATRLSDAAATEPVAIALGYLERQRLGMGSAFRLVEQASRDPRMPPAFRTRLAWGLVDQLLRGHTYEVEPEAADRITATRGVPQRESSGARHLALIAWTVGEPADPRVGEQAVRIAYALGAAEGTVVRNANERAAELAALARDRLEAREDAVSLLTIARARRQPFLAAVVEARAQRQLRLEHPSLVRLSAPQEARALALAEVVRDSLRAISENPLAPAGIRITERWLTPSASVALGQAGSILPPRAALVSVLTANGIQEGPIGWHGDANEETFVAGLHRAADRGRAAIVGAKVAVALRAMAQEPVWFPGDPGPTGADVTAALGLAGVSFAADVPATWHAFYLRMLSHSLRDFQRVFPQYSAAGLRVRFESDALPGGALAMHDPSSRTLRLSVRMGAGTIAHELAHDLDWQAARRVFARSGGYSTDRAARDDHGTLGQSVRGLASARFAPGATGGHSQRPAEIFARGVDWMVASALARSGRSNGYLSAIQDVMITGATAASASALAGTGATALVEALGQMTHVPDSIAVRFRSDWASTATDLALMGSQLAVVGSRSRRFVEPTAQSGMFALARPRCEVETDGVAARTRARLTTLMLDARARGLVARRAGFQRGPRAGWAAAALGNAPWSPVLAEEMVERYRALLETELDRRAPAAPAPFTSTSSC